MPPRLATDPPTPLRLALERVGVSQSALARSLGCQRQHVRAWVNGEHTPIPDRRQRIAQIVGISVEELWPDADHVANPDEQAA